MFRRTCSVALTVLVVLSAMPTVQAQTKQSDEAAKGRWAVLVGVDDYSQLGKLRFAGNDQKALAEQLVAAGFPRDQVFLLYDKATEPKYMPFRTNIERELRLVLGLAAPGDLVIVAFSGHGVQLDGKSYLCPLDAEIEQLAATSIPLDGVYDRLAKSTASLKLLLVDACRNDVVPVGRRSVAISRSLGEFAGVQEKPPEGILLLASCAPGQVSMEDEKFGHGVFMHYLLEGLRGHAADTEGTVTLAGLYDYASLATKKYVARKFSESQTPALKGEISGPFEIGKARQQQREITNSIGMKLVLVPAGEFMMGSPESESGWSSDEGPPHRVRITKPFYLGQYEVTYGQFRQFAHAASYRTEAEKEGNDRTWLTAFSDQADDHPVSVVSWNDAVAFCEWLIRKERKTYRLPTEAEWEYACRTGSNALYCFGNDERRLGEYAWYVDNSDGTIHRVGRKRPNAWGLYDMHGSLWEWCGDRYDSSYYAGSPQNDPTGPSGGSDRVYRGGGWLNDALGCRSAHRSGYSPGYRGIYLGFRVAQVLAD